MYMNNFVGTGLRLTDIDLPRIAQRIGVGEDEMHAVIDVETRGHGFDSQKRPIILFERHIFYRQLKAAGKLTQLEKARAEKLAHPQPGGYGKESEQYAKLFRALEIDREAALNSCSWGLGQVMGFNAKLAGYANAEQMVRAFMLGEAQQLDAVVSYIINAGLAKALREHKWAEFARGYNGPNYARNQYDVKLANAFAKWSRIKDTPYSADVIEVVEDAAAVDRISSTQVVTTVTGISGAAAAVKEAVDATKDGASSLAEIGPWVLVALLIIGGAIYVFGERSRKKAAGQQAMKAIVNVR